VARLPGPLTTFLSLIHLLADAISSLSLSQVDFSFRLYTGALPSISIISLQNASFQMTLSLVHNPYINDDSLVCGLNHLLFHTVKVPPKAVMLLLLKQKFTCILFYTKGHISRVWSDLTTNTSTQVFLHCYLPTDCQPTTWKSPQNVLLLDCTWDNTMRWRWLIFFAYMRWRHVCVCLLATKHSKYQCTSGLHMALTSHFMTHATQPSHHICDDV